MKRHPVRQRYRMVELQRWRDKRGLQFHLQPANWPFNARLADGVVIAALEAGHDPDRYLRRAFAAVWEDQLNLADPATIAKLADESGLPGKQLVERSGAEEISRGVRAEPPGRARRPMCSVRRSMCWRARCSGDRTASNCWKMR
jgi:2-hydroxychromene-2-carboxylate isomerase